MHEQEKTEPTDRRKDFIKRQHNDRAKEIVLKKHDREREEMRYRLQAQIDKELSRMKADFDRQFSRAREKFLDRCGGLKSSHDASWAEIREAWQDYNNARAAAFTQVKSRQENVSRNLDQGRGRGRTPL